MLKSMEWQKKVRVFKWVDHSGGETILTVGYRVITFSHIIQSSKWHHSTERVSRKTPIRRFCGQCYKTFCWVFILLCTVIRQVEFSRIINLQKNLWQWIQILLVNSFQVICSKYFWVLGLGLQDFILLILLIIIFNLIYNKKNWASRQSKETCNVNKFRSFVYTLIKVWIPWDYNNQRWFIFVTPNMIILM